MRTTLTLDPDVALKLKRAMREKKVSLKQAVNAALRIGLAADHAPRVPRLRVEPHACRFKPGIDLDKLNQLADELEAEAARAKLSR